ncbi:MAG: hypothetical protein DSY42_02070 [Aquifex sp.]|nr:MAG: hypothetical protein DSY42_02070 [Aquifex sp.]
MSRLERYIENLQKKREEIAEEESFFLFYTRILKEGGRVIGSKYGKIGSSKITTNEGSRILREGAIVEKYEDIHLTYSEKAKISLLRVVDEYGGWRWKKEQKELLEAEARIPQYVEPCRLENALYVDISGAYFTIYRRFLYADYYPDKFLKIPSKVPDFSDIRDFKLVRNSVFGLMRTTKGIQYTYSNAKLVNIKNPLYHPSLCLLTYDVLNAIALEMIERAGAVYVNTDGYIIPFEKYEEAKEIAEEWGFRLKIEGQGEAHVVAVGCYRVGAKISEPYKQNRISQPRSFRAVRCLSDLEWLKFRYMNALRVIVD